MANIELKNEISKAIKQFSTGSLVDNGINLFRTLGYETDRQSHLDNCDYQTFSDTYISEGFNFNPSKAIVNDWKYVDLLFQLSKDEVHKKISQFNTEKVDNTIIESYLFICIELVNDNYSRTELSLITREVNKLFPMPVMILFKYGNVITLSIINRRIHKRESNKDVLEKVTLIKDININSPHRAHIEIFHDLAFDVLNNKFNFTNFVELHNAWQKVLDTKELNKKFFSEISAWYFWATKHFKFPSDTEKNREIRNATSVIRLITRLIFVWFLKEKGLVPQELFDKKNLLTILKNLDDGTSTFYKAILQNLFFATLNTEMGKRKFRSKSSNNRDGNFFIHNVFRYEDYFNSPNETLKTYFDNIPFLNGGLFECLDKEIEENGKLNRIRIDGFSDRDDNPVNLPNEFFFCEKEKSIDLNEIYGTKNKTYKFRGIIDILDSYKFTITENTPIEEEIALDPELLGKVFENLLANYNPETQTTARKQTGSFYTPREIVNYMVDESLIAYLKKQLINDDNIDAKLRDLLSYSDSEPDFIASEKVRLISAIDNLKILDPACGSGAYPMGILHKLVHILHKLDPKNNLWKQRQIDKASQIDDSNARDAAVNAIEEAFENNELDYGRKLYLIENCIYGVDIQPIAAQISKLRFFISLIVEQKATPQKENLGIRPLPNLETKFVAANTLIGLNKEKDQANLFENPEVEKIKNELKKVRHSYFEARTPKTKEKYRNLDKELREKLAVLLESEHYLDHTNARRVASWDPYDQNYSADFFEPEWMFGLKDGFDIVIGNPPYVQLQSNSGELAKQFQNCKFQTFERTGDIYTLFYEKGIQLLKPNGLLCYITSNKWMRAGYGEKLRAFFTQYNPIQLVDLGPGVFENVTVDTNILLLQKATNQRQLKAVTLQKQDKENISKTLQEKGVVLSKLTQDAWFIGSNAEQQLKEKIERIGKPLKEWDVNIYYGIKTGLNEAFIITTEKRNEILANCQSEAERQRTEAIIKPILRGRDIKRYHYEWAGLWVIVIPAGWTNKSKGNENAQSFIEKTFPALMQHLKPFEEKAKKRDDQGDYWWELRKCAYYPEFEKEKVVWGNISYNSEFCFVDKGIFINAPANLITTEKTSIKLLVAIMNSKIFDWLFKQMGIFLGHAYEWKKQYVEQIKISPITTSNELQVKRIEDLVDKILAAKKANPQADTQVFEKEINEMVYKLYDLTEEEIRIVEGGK